MTDDPVGPSEPELALISVSRVLFDILISAGIVHPHAVDNLLEIQQNEWMKQGRSTAAGILAVVRNLSSGPKRQQQLEELRKLIMERPAGQG